MKKFIPLLLALSLLLTAFTACDIDFGGDSDRNSNKKGETTSSSVKTYVYDYDDISELEEADSPAELDEKKWKSASKFDLASQWVFTDTNDSFGANVCKIENTSNLAMDYELSFTVKGNTDYVASLIGIYMAVMEADGTVIHESMNAYLSDYADGTIFTKGTIPAGETYYLTIMQTLDLRLSSSTETTTEKNHDHGHAEEYTYEEFTYEEYSYDGDLAVEYETVDGNYFVSDSFNGEHYTAVLRPNINIEFGSGAIYEEYTFIYINPGVEFESGYIIGDYIIGGNGFDYVIGDKEDGTIKYPISDSISGSPSFTLTNFDAKVYLNCKATKTKGENDKFGNDYDEGTVSIPNDSFDDSFDNEYDEIIIPPGEIGDPGEYDYNSCYETVYVNNPGSEITLRSEDYRAKGSLRHGTELTRIGISTDAAGYWSMIEYNGETFYVATKFLTTLNDPEEGFVDVTKTVYISAKTGSLNIRNMPSMEGMVIGYAVYGDPIDVIAEHYDDGWYKIVFVDHEGEYKIGYITSDPKYYEDEIWCETETWWETDYDWGYGWDESETDYDWGYGWDESETDYDWGYGWDESETDYPDATEEILLPMYCEFEACVDQIWVIEPTYLVDAECNPVVYIGSNTELTRVGVSIDGYWSEVIYKGEPFFINSDNLAK